MDVQQDIGRPLPKFGEWDVNNPASAEGFTVIFTKARDQKMSNGAPGTGTPSSKPEPNSQYPPEVITFIHFNQITLTLIHSFYSFFA